MERLTPSSPLIRLWDVKLGGKKSAPNRSTKTGSRHRYCFSVKQGVGQSDAHAGAWHRELSRLLEWTNTRPMNDRDHGNMPYL
jgi:hypothetical protein